MNTRGQKARNLFLMGYNCSQSVFCAFSDLTGMDEITALKVAQGLGGGVGRMRGVCGTVTGAALVIGLLFGTSEPKNNASKADVYKKVREFSEVFKQKEGTIICAEHLKLMEMEKSYEPENRTENYYSTRPCLRLVEEATEILDDMITKWKDE